MKQRATKIEYFRVQVRSGFQKPLKTSKFSVKYGNNNGWVRPREIGKSGKVFGYERELSRHMCIRIGSISQQNTIFSVLFQTNGEVENVRKDSVFADRHESTVKQNFTELVGPMAITY